GSDTLARETDYCGVYRIDRSGKTQRNLVVLRDHPEPTKERERDFGEIQSVGIGIGELMRSNHHLDHLAADELLIDTPRRVQSVLALEHGSDEGLDLFFQVEAAPGGGDGLRVGGREGNRRVPRLGAGR